LNSHYLLRLNLAENQPLRSLRIEVEDRSARVFHPAAGAVAHGDRPTATTNPPVAVRIEQAVFHDRELTLALGSGGDGGGPVLVRIRVNDSTGRRIFDQSKSLTPRGDRVRARIRFTRLPHGSYTFLIEAGRAATTFGTLRVIRGVIAP
jgi:hypothetical protein